jgi:uncharacterized protein (DUF2062 family)
VRERLAEYRSRIWDGIERALTEDNSPHEIAASFALGTFIAVLPTGGTALVLFVVIAYLFERISKIGLLAAIVIFNPVVKWSIYGASFWLGTRLLGPVSGVSLSEPPPLELSFTAGPDIVLRHLLGNFIFAIVLAVLGYVIVLRLVRIYLREETGSIETVT